MTSVLMKTPIIVDGHGNVSIFESVEYAEQYLEPIDVKNEEYVVYNGEGHLLQLEISQKELLPIFGRTELIETVKISTTESTTNHSGELRKLLINFFRETKTALQKNDLLSLRELVDEAVSVYGYSR